MTDVSNFYGYINISSLKTQDNLYSTPRSEGYVSQVAYPYA